MKKLILLFSILLISSIINAQSFWSYASGSIKEDEAMDICYDNTGNIITAGYFSGPTTFAPGISLSSTSLGVADIYITKSNSLGNVIWAKKAGGPGSDRALSAKADASGNIYITGFYYGTATFGSITLTSVSGTQDGFIAKLDPSGNFLWASSFGGSLAEWGNAITVDNLGNPIITGQFQGTTNFGGTSLTSLINPSTSFSSFDVFIAKYNSAGTLVFVKQGAGKFDDRGLDIITDNTNNIYVCGQFSDTIQFQFSHPNTIMNASFVVKYNSTGNEVWFRKLAGVFSIAYSMAIDNTNKIYVSGDFQGTLSYFGTGVTSTISGLYNYKAFLLKIDDSGSFLWGKSESSNSYVSSKRVAIDANQDPYIYGEFNCTLNEYSDAFGTGVFNSIGFGDLFITKYNNSGSRQWFKQLGGPRNDKAHGLLIANVDKPIMAGSFEHHLNLPVTYGLLTTVNSTPYSGYSAASQPPIYCGAPGNYENYSTINCKGYSDAFLFMGVDLTRNAYDYYERSGTLCNLNKLGCCINGSVSFCPDTINLCKNGYINANTKTGEDGYIGPLFHYSWNGSLIDTNKTLFTNTTGYKNLKVTSFDGCYTSLDTVYVKINPLPPPPVITDSYGANTLQPPLTHSIHICGPSTITLTGGNVSGTAYGWSGPYISTHDSVATINTTGNYIFNVVDLNGCSNENEIYITIDSPIPNLFPKQKNDSVTICAGDYRTHIICDSISNPTLSYPYPCVSHTGSYFVSTSPGLLINPVSSLCDLSFNVSATTSGNYTYTAAYLIHNLCVNDTVFFTGHVYIKVLSKPTATLTLSGSTLFCPGDSTLITSTISALSSTNVIVTSASNDSLWFSTSGYAYFTASLLDTVTGCTNYATSMLPVSVKPNPFIILSPYNSIICPSDSVKLTVSLPGAINYEWHGPGGLIPINSQFIYVQTAGFYHCVVTDNTGCVFTLNTVEVKQYSTPFLTSSPSNVICSGSPLNLHVTTLDSTLITWGAPIFGTGATKVITLPGIYTCSVTMCSITTTLSILIIASNPTASITATGPTTVCPFDSVLLTGNPGMANYVWQPGSHLGINYSVHAAGCYTLEVTDAFGCTKKSAPVCVSFTSAVAPISLGINDTICAGQTATLTAIPSGSLGIDWFPYSSYGSVLGSGGTFITPTLSTQTTYYASSVDASGCHSSSTPVTAYIYPTSVLPVIVVDTTVCFGDTLKLLTPYYSGATYNWSGPASSSYTSNLISIPNADSTNAGTYTLQISGYGCTSPTTSVNVGVYYPIAPIVYANDSMCEHSNYYYPIITTYTNHTYDWTGPGGFAFSNDTLSIINTSTLQSGTYSVVSNVFGCLSSVETITLTILAIPPTPVIALTPSVCVGDTIFLASTIPYSYTHTWLGTDGLNSNNTNTFVITSGTLSVTHYYSLVLNNYFCYSLPAFDTVNILVNPIVGVTPDTIVCDGSAFTINCISDFPNYLWNTGATSSAITPTVSGTYYVTSQNGICSTTDSVNVTILDCSVLAINVFSPNNDGVNDVFRFNSKILKHIHCEITNRWGEKVGEFEGIENGWNGNNLNNKPCENGTYFYIAEITTIEGVSKSIKGFLNLFK